MKNRTSIRKNKRFLLNQTKLRKLPDVPDTMTETNKINIEKVVGEVERNQQAWLAQENFIETAIAENLVIEDVFGRLRA